MFPIDPKPDSQYNSRNGNKVEKDHGNTVYGQGCCLDPNVVPEADWLDPPSSQSSTAFTVLRNCLQAQRSEEEACGQPPRQGLRTKSGSSREGKDCPGFSSSGPERKGRAEVG